MKREEGVVSVVYSARKGVGGGRRCPSGVFSMGERVKIGERRGCPSGVFSTMCGGGGGAGGGGEDCGGGGGGDKGLSQWCTQHTRSR